MNTFLSYLQQWTKYNQFECIYDTRKDEYHIKTIQQILYNKKNIIILIQTNEDDIFGSYHSSISSREVVSQQMKHSGWIWEDHDKDMFLFTFSTHSETLPPQHFPLILNSESCFCLYPSENHFEIVLWICYCLNLLKPLNCPKSFIFKDINSYYEMNSSNDLIGKSGLLECFSPKRVLLYQCI